MTDLVEAARAYVRYNLSNGDLTAPVGLVEDLADEVERLRGVLIDAHNRWRHDFAKDVDEATDKLFKKLAAPRTKPFTRAA